MTPARTDQLSRRQFLNRSGALAGALALADLPVPASDLTLVEPLAGRAFHRTDVYSRPDRTGTVTGSLAPDSVSLIRVADGEWYQLADHSGCVPREAMQPIAPYTRPDIVEAAGPGFWAELVAPVSAVRQWCAGHAPVITRLGYGAVVYVMDRLRDDHKQLWYGLAAAPGTDLIGWGSALHYARWIAPTGRAVDHRVRLVTNCDKLLIMTGGRIIACSGVCCPGLSACAPLTTTLTVEQPGAPVDMLTPLGLPWSMKLASGQRLYGVFWHNRFGASDVEPTAMTSQAIELPIITARWLYMQSVLAPRPVEVVIE